MFIRFRIFLLVLPLFTLFLNGCKSKENGDMWSWFMSWNGDYTRADIHNGATWGKKIFGYDFVMTRDKMPSLKN